MKIGSKLLAYNDLRLTQLLLSGDISLDVNTNSFIPEPFLTQPSISLYHSIQESWRTTFLNCQIFLQRNNYFLPELIWYPFFHLYRYFLENYIFLVYSLFQPRCRKLFMAPGACIFKLEMYVKVNVIYITAKYTYFNKNLT